MFCLLYFANSITSRSTYCHFHTLHLIFCHWDIKISILCFSDIFLSIFWYQYFIRRYFAYSIFCDSIFCNFDILSHRYFAISIFFDFDVLFFDILYSIFCDLIFRVSIFCDGSGWRRGRPLSNLPSHRIDYRYENGISKFGAWSCRIYCIFNLKFTDDITGQVKGQISNYLSSLA